MYKRFAVSLLLAFSSLSLAQTAEQKGYEYLINGDYIGCGIPVTVMQRATAAKTIIPPPVMRSFFPIGASPVFKASGLPGRNEDNVGIQPYFNAFDTPRGVKALNFNCLSCHGEKIDGRFVVGLGNRSRDFTQDLRNFSNILGLFAWTSAEKEETAIFQRSTNAIAPYIQTKTIGVNPAVNLTYALFAHRNPSDFTWSEQPTMEPPPTEFPPVDVPPWWRSSVKNSMFYNAEFSTNHHRIMTLASTLCIEDATAMRALEPHFRDVEAFVKSLKAPAYPGTVNQALASEGKPLFESKCAACHGSYAADGTMDYPNRIIPIEKIGTDRALMDQQTGPDQERFRKAGEETSQMLYGEGQEVNKNLGYIAPPLNGIWATAPFFHNGSVPHLEGVLNSKARPKAWQKLGLDSGDDYDLEHIGVKFKELNYGQDRAPTLTKRYIYDTRLKGYGNAGHVYGDKLSERERAAVIEYLKTL